MFFKEISSGGSKWGVNCFQWNLQWNFFWFFFNEISSGNFFRFFFNEISSGNFFRFFFQWNQQLNFFSSIFCSKSLKTKNITPDAPTDFGDFSFFALSLIECKRQTTCYVWGGGEPPPDFLTEISLEYFYDEPKYDNYIHQTTALLLKVKFQKIIYFLVNLKSSWIWTKLNNG